MIEKVLIANRGEIALRIIRACRELGIRTVAVYSEADRDSLHVRCADEAVCIGPPPSGRSYLNIPNIISAALISNADSIHPGYGFLAENSHFAEICQTHGLKFIGPSVSSIEMMGDKASAKEMMAAAGVPVIPGSPGPVSKIEEAASIAAEIGYPVIIKASAGGGGKGMRVVWDECNLSKSLMAARTEAEAAFGSDEVYIEKFIEEPRHIEVQILGDEHGNIIHLGERDCSIQRRHQKMIEESPSPVIDDKLREEIGKAAVKGAMAAGYYSAGTIEFLLDKSGRFYFIEMNTRVQVEHPVTEMVTGVDIVKEQLLVASGEKLSMKQDDVVIRGHSIECRINAEDPEKNFMPCPGRVEAYHIPGGPGIRIDSAVYSGYCIPPYYDSMVAKLISWGRDRDEAIVRMERALDEFIIEGIKTTIPFHSMMMRNERFRNGSISANHDLLSILRDS